MINSNVGLMVEMKKYVERGGTMKKYFLLLTAFIFLLLNFPAYANNLIEPGISVGDFYIGMSANELISKMGTPVEKHPMSVGETWWYSSGIGFSVQEQVVLGVTLMQNQTQWYTKEGIRMGSTFEQVKQAYGVDYEYEQNKNEETKYYYDYLIDYVNLGIIFNFKNNVVTKITIYDILPF